MYQSLFSNTTIAPPARAAGSRGTSFSAAMRTDNMLPSGRACISAPRRATSRAASGRFITPAITAAQFALNLEIGISFMPLGLK